MHWLERIYIRIVNSLDHIKRVRIDKDMAEILVFTAHLSLHWYIDDF